MDEGRELIFESPFGRCEAVTLAADIYEDTGKLCLSLVSHSDGYQQPFATSTVNIGEMRSCVTADDMMDLEIDEMQPYLAYVKDCSENQGMIDFIKKNHLGYIAWGKSERVPFPLVQFNEETLRKFHCAGLEGYHQSVTAKYCGKIDFLGTNGSPGETIYYKNPDELRKERIDSEDCGRPITTLMYDKKMVVNRMKRAVLYFNERKIYTTFKDSKQERATHHSDR